MGILKRLQQIIRAKRASKPIKLTDVTSLVVGNAITIDIIDYQVQAVIEFEVNGWRWREYKLESGDGIVWLNVEKDDELELSMYKEERLVNQTITFDDQISHNGEVYYLQHKGEATVTYVEGDIGVIVGNKVKYADYESESEKFLTLEDWAEEIELSVGFPVNAYGVTVYG